MEKKYVLKNYDFNDISKRIIIPSFQRGIEWSTSKQKAFIKNVLDGNPFGCILISEDNRDSSGKYYLIDGLQRITALKLFKKNKFEFLDENFLNEKKLLNLIIKSNRQLGLDDSIDSRKKKLDKLKKDFFKILANGQNISDIYDNDKNDYILINNVETNKCLNAVKKEFYRYIDINNLKIPTILYKGSELADVFVNLNTTAAQLTKYEICAAAWDNKLFNINDDELKNKIIEKYKELENYGYDVEKSEEGLEDGVTFFEYCYSLGKIISEKSPYLFAVSNKNTNPCGFEILTLLCGLELGREIEIIKYFKNAPAKFLVDLKDCICNSILTVQVILKDWIIAKNLKLNLSDKTYMIYHMIMCYINLCYSITINPKNDKYIVKKNLNVSDEISKFKEYLPYHYLLDSISGFWDLNRQISDLRRLIDNDSRRYFSKPNYDDVNKAFNNYLENKGDLFNQKVIFENKLILDYLLKLKLTKMDRDKRIEIDNLFDKDRLNQKGKMIDFEHIVSKKKFEHAIGDQINKICSKIKVYSLGNLCYLDSKSNRSKGGKTVYEFKDQYDVFLGNVERSNYLEAINYPSKDELEFINERKEEFIKKYNQFIENREKELITELKNLLNEKLRNNE